MKILKLIPYYWSFRSCSQWMEVGEHGIVGATVLSLAEEVKGCGSGYVTIQCHPKVAVPVLEMPLRYPDAIRRHVQVREQCFGRTMASTSVACSCKSEKGAIWTQQ